MSEYILIVGQRAVAYVDKYLFEIKDYVRVDTRYLYRDVVYQRYGLKMDN